MFCSLCNYVPTDKLIQDRLNDLYRHIQMKHPKETIRNHGVVPLIGKGEPEKDKLINANS